jgi:hypothetical protein
MKHEKVYSNNGVAILSKVALCLIKPNFSIPLEMSNVFNNNVLIVYVGHNIIRC